jgi:hypothetical protein
VNSFKASTETHEKTIDISLKETRDLAASVTRMIDELKTTDLFRPHVGAEPGPWERSQNDKAAE